MESAILQQFLDLRLLDVGEGTDKFAYVEKAAEDLAKVLKRQRRTLIRSASVLLDERLAEGEPIVASCEEAIKKQWPTYRGRFQNDTDQLFRATLFQAVAHITADADITSAAIVFYTGISLLPFLTAAREDDLFRAFLLNLADRVEAKAAVAWTRPSLPALPKIEYAEDLDINIPGVDSKLLSDTLKAAAGPVNNVSMSNPSWPGADEAWLSHYGKASAEAMKLAVSTALNDLVPEMANKAREDDGKIVALLEHMYQQSADSGDYRRADLLYWKEALYSPFKRTSHPENCNIWR